MSTNLRLFLLAGIIMFLLIIVKFLKTKRLNLKYTLLWIFATFIMIIITVFPPIIIVASKITGVQVTSNFVFLIIGFFSILIMFSLTAIVSKLNNRVNTLTQKIALMEKNLRECKNH